MATQETFLRPDRDRMERGVSGLSFRALVYGTGCAHQQTTITLLYRPTMDRAQLCLRWHAMSD